MYASLLITALVATSAPVAKPSKPLGPPPKIVLVSPSGGGPVHLLVTEPQVVKQTVSVSAVENGETVVKLETREATILQHKSVALADVGATFRTAGGQALTAAEASDKLQGGGHLIIPAERDPIDVAYTILLAPDAIVAEYAKDGKRTISAATQNPTQPAPRFVAVKADEKGVLRIPAQGKREVIVKVPSTKEVDGVTKIDYTATKQSVLDLVPTPFDDVTPTVTTADGKPVKTDDAKRRLSAGTIVLVSANGKPVGEPFLKLVKPETLVLSSAKMVPPLSEMEKRQMEMVGKMKQMMPAAPPAPMIAK